MGYAIISDIHANIHAFEAVMDSFLGNEERVVCPGDVVDYGAFPSECLEMLLSIPAICVMGNHDAAVAGLIPANDFNFTAAESEKWTHSVLSAEEIEVLNTFPMVRELDGFEMAHGTLHDAGEFRYMMTASDAMHTFEVMKTGICVVGHSHVPGVFVLRDGRVFEAPARTMELEPDAKYIINAGSVGQPRDGDPRACYCVLDPRRGSLEFRRVEYDVNAARDAILDKGLPVSLGDRLLSGR